MNTTKLFEEVLLNNMMDKVIQKYGFEDEKTIGFYKLVEEYEESGAMYKRIEIFETFKEIA